MNTKEQLTLFDGILNDVKNRMSSPELNRFCQYKTTAQVSALEIYMIIHEYITYQWINDQLCLIQSMTDQEFMNKYRQIIIEKTQEFIQKQKDHEQNVSPLSIDS